MSLAAHRRLKRREKMPRVFRKIASGLFILATTGCAVSVAQAHGCTPAQVAGNYGFTLTGTVVTSAGNISVAAVGRATVGPSGRVIGSEARSVGGEYADEAFAGVLTVNSDCTGSITLDFSEGGTPVRTSVLSLVFDENENEIRMVQKSFTLPNGSVLPVIITVEAKRIQEVDRAD